VTVHTEGVAGRVAAEDEASLVVAARSGSRVAVGRLFDRHWSGVWKAAFAVTGRRDLADDVAQEAFVKAMVALGRFDERRPLAPWLRRIAVNHAVDLLRRERRTVGPEAMPPHAVTDAEPDPALHAALGRLAWERRTVIVLRYWLGYRLEEIAEILTVPVGTVSSRLRRGLDDLRGYLEESHG
jgi:RNA polymerase sigma-70 factor (ECF subfamily)